jgi:hypothetical protein
MGVKSVKKSLFLGGQFDPDLVVNLPRILVVNLVRNQVVNLTGFSRWSCNACFARKSKTNTQSKRNYCSFP